MKTIISLYAIIMLMMAASCNKTETDMNQPENNFSQREGTPTSNEQQMNMPAYFDGRLLMVSLMRSSYPPATTNPGSRIYVSNDLDQRQDYYPVIDAVQYNGTNPVWQQVLIVFNYGYTPRQFSSDEEIKAAADGMRPEITLNVTNEMYTGYVMRR
jgi:hypothetical protein